MKIQFASDLHLELWRDLRPFRFVAPTDDADVIVLAGDIDTGTNGVRFALDLSADRGVPVVYVLGNHEFYGHSFPDLIDECRRLARGEGLRASERHLLGAEVYVLENDVVVLGGVRFLGCTLWTDFALQGTPERSMRIAHSAMNDYSRITASNRLQSIRPEDTRAAHTVSRQWLGHALREEPWGGKTVVVTHHAPLREANHPQFVGGVMTPAFVSNLSDLIDAHDVAAWIFGHTHACIDLHRGGTRIVSNQLGYPWEASASADGQTVFGTARAIDV